MNFTLRRCCTILMLLVFYSIPNLVLGQLNEFDGNIRQAHFSEIEKAEIPGDKPSHKTKAVCFCDAGDWFANNDLALADFESVEAVEIYGTSSKPLSDFISQFPNLKHVSLVELGEDVDLESVVRPLSNSKTLRSMEINMVDVAYRDFTFLATFNQLTKLSFDVTLSEKELVAFQKLKNLRCLEIGLIAGNSQLAPVELPQLKELTLSDPSELVWFTETIELDRLKIWSKCSNEDVKNIAKFVTLKSVDLRVDSTKSLSCLSSLEKLETLKVVIERN